MNQARLLCLSAAVFFLSMMPNRLLACGYNYVSQCATTLEINTNGPTSFFYVGTCTWMTNLQNHNFGTVTSLVLHKGSNITWESCTNRVMNARIKYRIYATGATPGAFSEVDLSTHSLGGGGDYRLRTYSALPDVDLLSGLAGGTYTLELFYISDVDTNGDNAADATLTLNNGGANYKATFTKTGGGGGGMTVSFPAKTNVSCPGGANGSLTAAASGSVSPYTYVWSNGLIGATISNLPAGIYTVTATSSNGTTGTANTNITQPATLVVNVSATDETSGSANNGTATATATGGTAPYSYVWSTGASGANINNLDSGTYTVTATDNNGCTTTASAVVSVGGSIPGGYCNSSGSFPWNEWLGEVIIGSLDKTSDKSSYSNFTSAAPPQLTAGDSYPMTLKTGNGWFGVPESWRAWIDFNRNGTFEATELVLDQTSTPPNTGLTQLVVNQNIDIPSTADEGITRMRVAIKRGGAPTACEAIQFGEVEDYHVRIMPPSGSCTLTATVGNLQCNDNATPTNPADDKYTFSLTVTAVGGSTGWTAVINGVTQTGAYGVAKNLGPYTISAGNLTFTVKDATDQTCPRNVTVVPPAPCSNQVPCSIAASATNIACDNNGTTGTGTDDKFTFSLLVSGSGTGTGWATTINGTNYTGFYNVAQVLGPFDISGGALNFTVRDAQNATCTTPITVNPPAPCSTTGGPTSYCESKADFPWHEWISRVTFSGIDKTSSKWYYSDFTGFSANVSRGQTLPITVYTSYSWELNQPHIRVWVDWNRDGQFQEPGEIAFQGILTGSPSGSQDAPLAGSITVPATASLGATRMRVSLKRNGYATACEALIPFGEVEDYSVNVAAGATGGAGGMMLANNFAPTLWGEAESGKNRLQTDFYSDVAVQNFRLERAAAPDFEWQPVEEKTNVWLPEHEPITLDFSDANLATAGAATYRLALGRADGSVVFSNLKTIVNQPIVDFAVFPNPLGTGQDLSLNLEKLVGREASVQIIHATGKPVFSANIPLVEEPILTLPVGALVNGEYFVFVQSAGMRPVGKKLSVIAE